MANMQDGFYRHDQTIDYIFHANIVNSPTFTLLRAEKDNYDLPIGGWYWFDSPQEACEFFGVNIEDYEYLIEEEDEV